ncbi:MAG: hypothetical protein ABFC65_01425 [Rectinema sp.]
MRLRRLAMCVVLVFVLAGLFGAGAQPIVSTKQDIAVFSLGYYGWFIPLQALGTIDLKIQEVFSDIGRFTVFGTTQRLSSQGLQQFIDTLRRTKQANFVLPEQYQFGEAFLTKAEFERLSGAFIVVVPVVTNFAVYWDSKAATWNCNITTGITFIDVAHDASVIAVESIDTSGSDKTSMNNAIMYAINAIPSQLEYSIRSIPQFQISTRILEAQGSTVKIQLGADMGLKKGDEYAIMEKQTYGIIEDTREVGLIVVTDVRQQVSTGRVLYCAGPLDSNTQLKEIARQGVDLDLYFHSSGGESLPGLRMTASRGYFPLRPYFGMQVPVNYAFGFLSVTAIPINTIVGAEYMIPIGRLHIAPYAGFGITYIYLSEAIGGYTNTNYLSHFGFQAGGRVGYLVTRNTRLFVDVGFDYWKALDTSLFSDYGGLTLGAGISFKL